MRLLASLLATAALLGLPALASAQQQVTGAYYSLSNTPGNSTSAYTSGNVLGVGGVQSFFVQPGSILQSAVIDYGSGTVGSLQVDLILFGSLPTGTYTDASAVAVSANDEPKIIGVIHASDCTVTQTTRATCQGTNVAAPYRIPGGVLYVVAVVRGTPTFAGSTDVTFWLHFIQ